MFRPKLRAEVLIERIEGDAVPQLKHRVLEHSLTLDPGSWAVAERCDGTRDLDQLERECAPFLPGPGRARELVRTYLLLGFLEGSGDEPTRRIAALHAKTEQLQRMVLDGARFACQGSGECCQNYLFGPLKDSDIERIEKLPIAEKMPQVGPGPYWKIIERKDGQERFLVSHQERCVFLDERGRCGLHATFGAEAKPDLCRLYPIEEWTTFDAIRTYDKGTCASFATACRSGAPLVEQLVQLRPLFYGGKELSHPAVRTPYVNYDFALHKPLMEEALLLVKAGLSTPPATLRAVARSLRGALEALASCPLEAGAPERLVAELKQRPPLGFYEAPAEESEVARGLQAICIGCDKLLENATERLRERRSSDSGGDVFSEPLVREMMQIIHLVRGAAGALLEPLEDPYIAEVKAVPIYGLDCEDVLRISLRQQLFGPRVFVEDRPLAGLVRMALAQLTTIYGGRMRASGDGAAVVRASDLSRPHMLSMRVLDQLGARNLAVELEEHGWAVLEALPRLIGWGEPLPG